MIQTATAEFTGADPLDGDYPYVDVTWDEAFDTEDDYIILDGLSAAAPMSYCIKAGSKTETGCRVLAVDQFTGTVSVTAVPV